MKKKFSWQMEKSNNQYQNSDAPNEGIWVVMELKATAVQRCECLWIWPRVY